MQTKRYKMI